MFCTIEIMQKIATDNLEHRRFPRPPFPHALRTSGSASATMPSVRAPPQPPVVASTQMVPSDLEEVPSASLRLV